MKQPRQKLYIRFFEIVSFLIKLAFTKNLTADKSVKKFENLLSNYWNRKACFTLSTCRLSLYYVLKSLNLKKGSEVILNPLQISDFVNVIISLELKPVFVDMDLDTNSFIIDDLKNKINPNTKVLLSTYLTGILPNISLIKNLCEANGIKLIEDISQSYGSEVDGKKAGTFGFAAIGSLSPGKIISSIGGGFILLDSEEHEKKINELINKELLLPSKSILFKIGIYQLSVSLATSRIVFDYFTYYLFLFYSKVSQKKYGELHRPVYKSSYKESTIYDNPCILRAIPKSFFFKFIDLQADIGINTFNRNLSYGLKRRQNLAEVLYNNLTFNVIKFIPIKVKNFKESAFWHFPILLKSNPNSFQNYLLDNGIDVVGYGLKLCSNETAFSPYNKELKNSKKIYDNTFFLPLSDDLSENEIIQVSKVINNYKDFN